MSNLRDRIAALMGLGRRAVFNPVTLKERALSASLWSVGGMGVQYPLRLASNVILTALLAPDVFGLMATVTVLHIGLGLLSDVGISQSVIRSPDGERERYLRVAWTVQVIRGLIMASAMLLIGVGVFYLGPGLAAQGTVYADPRLPELLWISSIAVLAKGFESTAVLLAQRRMTIARLTGIEIAVQIVGLTVMIGLAATYGTYWAPVAGMVAGALASLALSHMVLPGSTMRLAWDSDQTREMWRFGRWLIGSSVGGYLLNHGDRLIFGAIMDTATFGVYAIAAMWVGLTGQVMDKIAGTIVLPVLSDLRNRNDPRLQRTLVQICFLFTGISGAAVVAILVGAAPLIGILYDPRYAFAAPFMQLIALRLCFFGSRPLTSFFTAHGDSDVVFCAIACGAIVVCTAPPLANIVLGQDAMIALFGLAGGVAPAILFAHPRSRRLGTRVRLAARALVGFQCLACIALALSLIAIR